ncbi:peptidase S8 [Paenibacillus psychroresistens]|uniref:Peptidase S8 n=2 Tax=Paenibacillus psychroresistens TaxID=1778678 RepID=A0A6B8RXC4_9BACL|nr:peptidase S8 [Paenibacillus psychroresistens]
MHYATKLTSGLNPRYIVRFYTMQNYNRFMAFISTPAESANPEKPKHQPLKIICGLSCSLDFINQHLKLLPLIASIETDIKLASLHAQGEQFIPWGVSHIRAPEVWSRSTGKRVKIGVIDTGVDYSHPDLQRSVYGGINLVQRHMLPMDDNGHGTHIAGTIAAASQRSGIIGVAPNAAIYAVKAFDYNGSAFVSDIIQGIEWCVRYRMDIINMSFGMKNHSKALEAAVRNAVYSGRVVVASSGNNGKKNLLDYPARFPLTIAVGATNQSHKIAGFSNRGHRIDIYAPGDKIYSTWLHGKYNIMSGTSMATSHVTGVIALMLAAKPGLSPRQIKLMLQRNASTLSLKNQLSPTRGEVSASQTLKSIIL